MTILKAITRADALVANTLPQEIKISWLSDLDSTVMIEIIRTHEGDGEYTGFAGYGADVDLDTELIAPEPYAEMYVYCIISKIDFTNGEFDRYQNTAAEFAAKYADFADFWNRTHTPKGAKIKYFGGIK